MSFIKKIVGLGLLAAAVLPAAPILAQSTEWSITPTVGYRFGGEFDSEFFDFFSDFELDEGESYGVTLERALSSNLRLELLWSHQETVLVEDRFFDFTPELELFDIDVDYYHVGLMYQWNAGQIHPFIVGSLGATQFDPEPSDLDAETRFSASFGGGVKFMFSNNVGLRLEGRLFNTFFDDDEEFYCRRDCRSDEDYVYQGEARAGLIFAF